MHEKGHFQHLSGYELTRNKIFLWHRSSGDCGGFRSSAAWVEWSAVKGILITWESILRQHLILPLTILHLFTFYVFNLLSFRSSSARVLVCFRFFSNNHFEFIVLCWYTCLVNGAETYELCCLHRIGFSEQESWILPRFPAMFFPH